MRYEGTIKIDQLTAESATVFKAVRFANSAKRSNFGTDEWKVEQYKFLRVLPRRMPYFIDDMGRIHPRSGDQIIDIHDVWAAASSRTLLLYRDKLEKLLSEVSRYPEEPPNEAFQGITRASVKKNCGKAIVGLHFPLDGWSRTIVRGLHFETTTQTFVPPNIGAFVAYASILLAQKPWSLRLSRCTQCEKYFINEPGKRGPKRRVCSDRCDEERGDPSARHRAQRARERRKERARL